MVRKSNDIDIVKKGYSRDRFNDDQVSELLKCIKDPIYFCENYVYIQHPIKGRVPFKLYPYQKEMMEIFHKHRFSIALLSRQMGKTSVAGAFLLWKAMFEPDMTILVVANKFSQAMEIMDRVRFSYENLEKVNWLRAGVVEYNKGTLSFDNGSRIICRATSRDSARGLSVSLLYCLAGDTSVTVKDKETGEIKDITLEDLYLDLETNKESDKIEITWSKT